MPRLSLLPPAPVDSSIRTAVRASDEEVMPECPLAVSSALAGMSRLLLSGGLGRELRGGLGVLSACALDEVLCSGNGVDLGRVLAGSATRPCRERQRGVLGRTGRRWLLRAVGPRRVWRLTDWVSEASSRQLAEISEKGLEPGY